MFKSIGIAAILAVMGATPAFAQSFAPPRWWEAISASDTAVAAVDWSSLDVNGSRRVVTFSIVSLNAGAVVFDYAVSTIDIDCAQPRYTTLRSSFYDRQGNQVIEDFVGDGSWTALNPGTMMDDVRREVCDSEYRFHDPKFHSALDLARDAWRNAAQDQ
ncbi:MAG: hypothetical protein KKF88_12490 [Alphaproteobacteria bacterium]|nr:hypothetical protein [Alphaproteobacteria bacterium]